mmetsp:Transcript_27847/g.60674  ORF Transcript_27847/g.60674 Transcript_27847/m.60674 type:complete len:337 (-) Transcript_27847:124-1134(-)
MLVRTILLSYGDKVNSDVTDHVSLRQLLPNLHGHSHNVFGILFVGWKLATNIDLVIEHLLMGGQNPDVPIVVQESLTRRGRFGFCCTFDEDFADSAQILKLRVVPCPCQTWCHKLQGVVQFFCNYHLGFLVAVLQGFLQRLIDSQHCVALSTEGIVQFHHDLAGRWAALQQCKDLLAEFFFGKDFPIAPIWMIDTCIEEDLAVARLGAPEGALCVVAEEGNVQALGQFHFSIGGVEAGHSCLVPLDAVLDALQRSWPREQLLSDASRSHVIAANHCQPAPSIFHRDISWQVAQVVLDQFFWNVLGGAHDHMHLSSAKKVEMPKHTQFVAGHSGDFH